MKTKTKKQSYERKKRVCAVCGYQTDDYELINNAVVCESCQGEIEQITQ